MMKKETVYPYDESFQKIAKKLPFRGAFSVSGKNHPGKNAERTDTSEGHEKTNL